MASRRVQHSSSSGAGRLASPQMNSISFTSAGVCPQFPDSELDDGNDPDIPITFTPAFLEDTTKRRVKMEQNLLRTVNERRGNMRNGHGKGLASQRAHWAGLMEWMQGREVRLREMSRM